MLLITALKDARFWEKCLCTKCGTYTVTTWKIKIGSEKEICTVICIILNQTQCTYLQGRGI